jgi:hypothetical protein
MTINNTSLVANLNAQYHNGYSSSQFANLIVTDSGTATVSGHGFNLNVTLSGIRTRATGSNFVVVESTSDERLKQDIAPESLGLDFIDALRPVEYRLRARPQMKYHGFIAQDMRSLITVGDDCLYQTNSDGSLGVDYVGLIAPLVKAVQQLSAKVALLEQT